MRTEDHLKKGEKSPYDRATEVMVIHTLRGKKGGEELRLFPVIALKFTKESSIVGDDAVFLAPEDAVAIGSRLIKAGEENSTIE